ncbi:transcriptional regulator, LacI family [Coriobacterium glomerans PW2]|uniref:Transcriptional regulator, LacI family n=1 Tax=Coriobacterium glomerans (strain ATCC 49209 / DSM 20642 / JCM 10262 / PW2) TaxID=700015 RepID=F2NAN3_CORGP|nr:LacI family DNA-binding transcriptional regulator [Coriobacterium glomerans]AEB07489.1 transcriptional regulator, LacI family [Coriobacterium glomerans PW2]
MARRVTLKDIARESGYSESAVSLVLNNRSCRLSDQSKRCIRETARRLRYRPNEVARGLAMSKSNTIGLVIPDIENPFFSSLAKRFEERCRETGCGLFIANSDDRSAYDCEQLECLDARGVDGIAYVASNGGSEDDQADPIGVLAALSVPFVMIDRVIDGVRCDKVYVDNELGAYMAALHLLDHGHRRIGCLANTSHTQNGSARLMGYRRALSERGITFEPDYVAECDYHAETGYAQTDLLIEAGVTAIFSTSDLITVGMLCRLRERDIRIPEDISIVSFDNSPSLAFAWPGITAVDQDIPRLSSIAFDMLTRRISGIDDDPMTSVVSPSLVVRNSVRSID